MQGHQETFQTCILPSEILHSPRENTNISFMILILQILVLGILNKFQMYTIVYKYKTGSKHTHTYTHTENNKMRIILQRKYI